MSRFQVRYKYDSSTREREAINRMTSMRSIELAKVQAHELRDHVVAPGVVGFVMH